MSLLLYSTNKFFKYCLMLYANKICALFCTGVLMFQYHLCMYLFLRREIIGMCVESFGRVWSGV